LWRECAKDERMPWQKELSEEKLTPARVLKSLAMNISEVGELCDGLIKVEKKLSIDKMRV